MSHGTKGIVQFRLAPAACRRRFSHTRRIRSAQPRRSAVEPHGFTVLSLPLRGPPCRWFCSETPGEEASAYDCVPGGRLPGQRPGGGAPDPLRPQQQPARPLSHGGAFKAKRRRPPAHRAGRGPEAGSAGHFAQSPGSYACLPLRHGLPLWRRGRPGRLPARGTVSGSAAGHPPLLRQRPLLRRKGRRLSAGDLLRAFAGAAGHAVLLRRRPAPGRAHVSRHRQYSAAGL